MSYVDRILFEQRERTVRDKASLTDTRLLWDCYKTAVRVPDNHEIKISLFSRIIDFAEMEWGKPLECKIVGNELHVEHFDGRKAVLK